MRRGLWVAPVLVILAGCLISIDETQIDAQADAGSDRTRPRDGGTSSGGPLEEDEVDAARPARDGSTPGTDATLPSDTGSPVDSRILGAWSLDEGSGTTARDVSGKGRDAVLSAGASSVTGGVRGGALGFGGSQSEMRVSSLDGAAFPRSGSLSLWFRWESMNPAYTISVFDDWDPSRPHVFIRHKNGAPSGEFQLAFQRVGGENEFTYRFNHEWYVPSQTWTHLVVTWDEATRAVLFAVNGSVAKEGTYDATFAPTSTRFTLGAGLNGRVDEVVLYDRPLSKTEALALP